MDVAITLHKFNKSREEKVKMGATKNTSLVHLTQQRDTKRWKSISD